MKGDAKTSGVTVADLSLLVDLFYLPYEHGISGKALLDCFRWLRDNASQVNKKCQLFGEKVGISIEKKYIYIYIQ